MRYEVCVRVKHICVLDLFQLVQLHELMKILATVPPKFNEFLLNLVNGPAQQVCGFL